MSTSQDPHQTRRLILAVAICGALIAVFMLLQPKPKELEKTVSPPPAGAQQASPPPGPAPSPAEKPADAPAAAAPAPATPPAAAATPGAPQVCDPAAPGTRWETEDFIAELSRCGGALRSFQMKGSQWQVKGQAIDLVRTKENPAHWPLRVQLQLPKSGGVDATEARLPIIPDRALWDVVSETPDALAFRWSQPEGLEVTRTYRRLPSRYGFQMIVEVTNRGSAPRLVDAIVDVYGYQDPHAETGGYFTFAEPHWTANCRVGDDTHTNTVGGLRSEGAKVYQGDVAWAGLVHKYFFLAVAPADREKLSCHATVVGSEGGVLRAGLLFSPPWTLAPGASAKRELIVYAGPKLVDELDHVSKLGRGDLEFGSAVDFGLFAFIARPLAPPILWLLKTFHDWVGNWGVAIILLTILVKLLTLYWAHKSMKSMRRMARLNPKVKELKKLYPNDPRKQQEEQMKLFRTEGVNPLAGCLPTLLQMPVWIALYSALSAAAELYNARFFGWMNDLTLPDRYYVLPVLIGALMFVQARMTPKTDDPAQQSMQMMMRWIMPLMFGAMMIVLPSGLGIYILTNSVLGMLHQLYINKTDPMPVTTPAVAPRPAPARSESARPDGGPRPGGKKKRK